MLIGRGARPPRRRSAHVGHSHPVPGGAGQLQPGQVGTSSRASRTRCGDRARTAGSPLPAHHAHVLGRIAHAPGQRAGPHEGADQRTSARAARSGCRAPRRFASAATPRAPATAACCWGQRAHCVEGAVSSSSRSRAAVRPDAIRGGRPSPVRCEATGPHRQTSARTRCVRSAAAARDASTTPLERSPWTDQPPCAGESSPTRAPRRTRPPESRRGAPASPDRGAASRCRCGRFGRRKR